MARFSDVPTLGGSDCGILTLIIIRGRAPITADYTGLARPRNVVLSLTAAYMITRAPSMGLAVMRKTVLQGVGLSGVVFVEVVLTQVLDIP